MIPPIPGPTDQRDSSIYVGGAVSGHHSLTKDRPVLSQVALPEVLVRVAVNPLALWRIKQIVPEIQLFHTSLSCALKAMLLGRKVNSLRTSTPLSDYFML